MNRPCGSGGDVSGGAGTLKPVTAMTTTTYAATGRAARAVVALDPVAEMLTAEWDSLGRDALWDVVACPTQTEALQTAVGHICGSPATATRWRDSQVISFAFDDNQFANCFYLSNADDQWAADRDLGAMCDDPSDRRYRGRQDRVRAMLRLFTTGALTIDEQIRVPIVKGLAAAELRAISVIPLWWQARINEGHTPDSARMMMSLIVDSTTLARLDFTDTAPPVLRCG